MSENNLPVLPSMDRRMALKVMAVAAATPGLASCASGTQPVRNVLAAGTAADPDLLAPVIPWERVLTRGELDTLAVLCDVIVPADGRSPSASSLGAHHYIDEWVSAPYDSMSRDQVLIRGGLVWLDSESRRRFGPSLRFRELSPAQRDQICTDIAYLPNARPGFEAGARFFNRVRDLTAGAFWTTEEGMQDLQYIGNVPLAQWDPPPREVLEHLGLT